MSERKRARRDQHRKQQRESSGLWSVLIVVAFIFGVGGFFFLRSILGSPPETSSPAAAATTPAADVVSGEPGEAVPIQGQQHVEVGEGHPDYNSDPPTSGWHLANAIPAGFYEETQVDEALVHNLELIVNCEL